MGLGEPLIPRDTAEEQQQAQAVEKSDTPEFFGRTVLSFVQRPAQCYQKQGNQIGDWMLYQVETGLGIFHDPHALLWPQVKPRGDKINNKTQYQLYMGENQWGK